MKKPSLLSRFAVFFAISLSMCGVVNAETIIIFPQVVVVNGGTPGYYNSSLGTILDGTAPQFPLPLGAGGGDPLINPSDEPNLSAAASILGNWLAPHAVLNPTNWLQAPTIPGTWAGNTETAIIYEINGGTHGFTNLIGNFDADNGLFVWVNGQFKFGARGPGLPSPVGQFEYTNVFLGNLLPGTNRIQILREDNFDATGYQVQITGNPLGGSVQTQSCVAASSGLVSWWRAEANGSDAMGAHDGTFPFGIAYSTGEVGQTFDFDGSSRRVSIADSVAFQLTNAMTLEAWVYPRAYGGFITFRGDNRGGLDTWVLDTYQSGFVNFQIDDAGNNYASVRAPIALNQWQHVAATWDRAGGDMKIYLNGALIQQTNTSIIPIGVLDSSQEPAIGIGNHGGTFHQFPFNGLIDELGIFNRALSAMEIQAIYSVGSAGKCAVTNTYNGDCITPPLGLAGWWRGEGSASDSAGTNNGILVGGTTFRLGGVGQEFVFDGVDDSVRIPVNGPLTPLDVGIGGGFTIEGWVNPTRLTIGPIAEWNDGAGGLGTHFWHSIDTITAGDGPGNLYGNIVDTSGISHSIVSPSGLMSTNTFNHVALTYDKTTGIAVIYHNRVAVKTQNLGVFTPQTSYDLHFGRRASGPFSDSFFKGSIDEMSLYNRALTAAEIESIALASYNGKCAATNPPPQVVAVPVITSFNPTMATIGSSVTLSGTNFSPVASNNIVYFGAVRAGVKAASAGSLTVTVPSGATHAPITVTVGKLTAAAPAAFLPSFVGNGSNITASSFAPGQNLSVADGPFKTIIADFDGDGKPDLVEDNAYAHNISLFRNISVTGTLDASSFAPRVDFPALGGTDSPRCMAVADVDGDGKLDVLVGDQATSSVVVYRNIATPGTLTTSSLAAPVSFAAGSYPHGLRVADLNGDGLPEILVANHSGNSISILRNLGTAGNLTTNSFAPQFALVTGPNPTDVAIADFSGDGKPDLVTTAFGGSQLSVFRNVVTPSAAVSNWFTLDTMLPALSGTIELAVADLDGDTKSDLVAASVHGYAVSVYRQQTSFAAFTSNSFAARVDFAAPGWVHNVAVGDFNGDTKPDIAAVGELGSYMAVFQNQSTPGSFTASSLAARVDYATGWNAWGVAVGDLDGDNRSDIVFANSYDDTLTFYRNIIPFGQTNSPDSCVNPPSGLVSWWKAENNAIDPINGHNGTLHSGTTFTTGEVGQGFSFNGTGSYVEIPSSAALKPNGSFTFEAWIKYSGNPGAVSSYCIAAKGIDAEAAMDWALTVSANSRLRPHVSVNGSWHYFDCATPLSAGNWYHVAMIYDGNHLQGYVNGVLDGSANVAGTAQTSDASLRIGAYAPVNGTGSKAYFSGSIDEAAFYDRNLSAGELSAIFNAGNAGKCPPTNSPFYPADGLVAHYSFSGDASDVSGNANHGVPSNMVLAADRFGVPNAAFSFNGQNAAVTVTDNPALRSLNSNYTFNAWVRFGSNPQIDAAILMKSAGAGDQRKWTFWRHVQAPPYGIGLLLNRVPGGQFQWNNDSSLTTGRWYMVTFSASATACLIAVDGQVVSAQSGNLTLPDTTGLAMSIGGAEPGGNQWFNGSLDDIRIYNRTFTSNDIAQLYQLESAQSSAVAVVPVITSFNPAVATAGSSVFISGTNFSPVASNNIVYFGAVRASVIAASPTNLMVTVPVGATFAPITVAVNGLMGISRSSFLQTFNGAGQSVNASTFAPRQDLTADYGNYQSVIADFDGDGKADLGVGNGHSHIISLFQNLSTPGSNVFAPRVVFPIVGANDGPAGFISADVDCDGRMDLLFTDTQNQRVGIMRNLTSPGTFTTNSFASPVYFAAGSVCFRVRVHDLDGDGRPDVVGMNQGSSTLSVFRNLGISGELTTNSFAPALSLATGANPHDFCIQDLDGDGKPDFAVANDQSSFVSLIKNVSVPGELTSDSFAQAVNLPTDSGHLIVNAGDVDGDGKPDLLVGGRANKLSVFRNQTSLGTLTTNSFATQVDFSVSGWLHNVVLGDINGDGKPEPVAVGELESFLSIFPNQSSPGSFTSASLGSRVDFGTGWNAWSASVGDLDGDGRSDVAFCNNYETYASVYRNVTPIGNSDPCVPAFSGLFAWWQAETNTYNSAGGGGGDFVSPSYTAGKVGTAFDFNGANNVVVADQPSFNPTNALTIECWVYARSLTVSYAQDLVSKDGEFSGPRQYMLTMGPPPGLDNGTGGFRAHVGVPGGFFYFIDGATKAQLNTWYHVAMTYDGSTLKLFVNGNLDAQLPVTGPIITSSEPIRLGGGAPGNDPAYFFNGRLDEVALYGRALSQNEIQAIYNSGSAGKCPLPPPPAIAQHPQDQTVNANATAQFAVTATGSPTLRYQWFFADSPLLYQTNSTLSIPSAQPINQGVYRVTVSNDFGFTISSNATLTVLTFPPVITRQPTNVTVIETTAANFSVQATGSVALAYQWLLNGTPLAGKTTTTLSFPSVQFSNAGNYSVIVTNPYGAVTSSVAVLTVNPRPPCAPVHDGLVSWWKGENNALDNWDSNNAYSFRNEYQNGKVGRAFSFPFIGIYDAPSLRVTNGLTIESWINPSSLSSVRVILSKFEYPLFQPFGTQSAYLLGTTNNGALFFTLTPNGSVRTNTTLLTTNIIPINQWTHVAATYDGAFMRLYINGSQVAQTNYNKGIFPGSTSLGIGGFAGGTSSSWQYTGLMDEVSIYNRALSSAEIQSIVSADLSGKCLAPPVITQQPPDQIVPLGEDVKFTVGASGSRPLAYQWYFNGFGPQFRILNATNDTLLIEKVRTNNVGLYFVTVSNSVGTNFSARAQLSTVPAPSCTEILPGLISWWPGDTNTLDAMGLNNIAQYSPVIYPTGKVASAFTFNGSQSRITVNNSASLNFTNNQNFSIEMWIKATPTNALHANVPLLEKRDIATIGWLGYSLSLNNGRLAFGLGARLPNQVVSNALFVSSSADLRDGFFHHVAVTVNRTAPNGGTFYVDGTPVSAFDLRSHTNTLANQMPLYIGGPSPALSNSYYAGLIDEPAIYNRTLTAAEILSIRSAGAAGRCKVKPIIVTQPVGESVTAGASATLSVLATGSPTLRYQWRRYTVSVPGGTNSILLLTNIGAINTGNYSVIVSNAFGSVVSSNAIIIINSRPTALSGGFEVKEDSLTEVVLTGTDPDGNNLTYSIVSPPTNGILSGPASGRFRIYTPSPNYSGPDSFTYKVNDGYLDSTNATISITVRPVNDAPTVQSQLITTDEDTPIAITLQASDIDGDALTYQVTPPSHGTLSGIAPNLIYTPETNYFGEDLFTFTVTDASNVVSQIAAVGITIRPINDAPVAKIVIEPLDELPGVTNTVLIAPACCDATLLLDGSQSTDVENDALTYVWLDGTNVIATTATVTNRFRPGTHNITLVVSDGITADMETMIVEIITPSEAVDFLKSFVEDSITERRLRSPLMAWLRGAEESFERCHVEVGVRFLELFQQRARDRIAPNDAELARQLVDTAQAIIEAAPDCDPCHRIGRRGKRGHHHDNEDHERSRDERRGASEVRGGKSSPR